MSLFDSFRVNDLVDIAFISLLLYLAIVWFRRARAAFVLLGIFILGGVAILAILFNLRLTAWLFQGFFAVVLLMIIVIFQEELRQIFERIAVWSLRRKTVQQAPSRMVDLLVETVADLAESKTGALIVLAGRDPLERHITGGIELEGRLSEPLLKSLFDPHSPGHDGAVVIEKEKVTRFAVHLPLSRDLAQLRNVGTRHTAGLGLSELTDALVLVVSEERGTISVARNSRLRRIENPQGLATVIDQFLGEISPALPRRANWRELIRRNWMEKLVSIGLAVILWYVFVARLP